jgi:tetratricopeptide (TPR) repeat protein
MNPNDPGPTVQEVLDRRALDYGPPLAVAWEWNRSGDSQKLAKAEQLLARLTEPGMFEFALPVWYERAFNLVRQKRQPEALELLERVARDFEGALDEDTLSLWARIHKDAGDAALAAEKLAEAERSYARAEELYERAYALGRDRFPGINVATLRFVRAGLRKALAGSAEKAAESGATELLATARALAAELLSGSANWLPRLPDDPIWMSATRGEAAVILGDWAVAEHAYREALDPAKRPLKHHPDSMKAQLKRLRAGYIRLGQTVPPPFDDPDAFFAQLSAPDAN